MSEVMEREEQLTPELEPQTEPEKSSLKQKWKNMPRKKRRRLIRWIIILAILAAAGLMLYKIFGGSGQDGDRDHDRGGAVRLDYCHSGGQRYDPRKEQRGHYHHHCRYHV